MKLVGVSGTLAGNKTSKAVYDVLAAAKLLDKSVETELIYLRDYELSFADGSPLAYFDDDTWPVADKIMTADCLVFGAPIYQASISGVLKNLLDHFSEYAFKIVRGELENVRERREVVREVLEIVRERHQNVREPHQTVRERNQIVRRHHQSVRALRQNVRRHHQTVRAPRQIVRERAELRARAAPTRASTPSHDWRTDSHGCNVRYRGCSLCTNPSYH